MAISGTNTENQNMRVKVLELDVNGNTVTGTEFAVLDGVTAGTAAASKAMITDSANGITGFRDTRSIGIFKQPAPAAKTGTVTLTAAELLTGLILGTPAAAANYTLPLASTLETALVAIYPGLANDDAFDFTIVNLATTDTFAITVLTNTGWTLSGEIVIPENDTAGTAISNATFRVRRTAANTYTLYRVG